MLKNFYESKILPKILNRSMRKDTLGKYRPRVIDGVSGEVLEIGFGSGLNLSYYKNVTKLYALEPAQELFDLTGEALKKVSFPVIHLANGAENIPLPDNSVDCVVSTWVMCSVDDMEAVLSEVKRVLRPGGKFHFIEHGKSHFRTVSFLQKLLTPLTKYCAGNCHLNRDIEREFKRAGFSIEKLQQESVRFAPLLFLTWGIAWVSHLHSIKLTRPSLQYKDTFINGLKEYQAEGGFPTVDAEERRTNFAEYVERLAQEFKDGRNEGEEKSHMEHLWLVDGDRYIGTVLLRHQLDSSSRNIGGNISYEIRPTERRKGYGTEILKLSLLEAKEIGLEKVLLTCDEDNIASKKIILKNGGVEDEPYFEGGMRVKKLRFWIDLR